MHTVLLSSEVSPGRVVFRPLDAPTERHEKHRSALSATTLVLSFSVEPSGGRVIALSDQGSFGELFNNIVYRNLGYGTNALC